MNKLEAFETASKIANGDNIIMVVTHNPYDEFEDSENSYGYYPQSSYDIVKGHESLIATVYPEGMEEDLSEVYKLGEFIATNLQ